MDMVDDLYMKYLPELIAEGKVDMAQVDDAVKRVLRLKFRLGLFETPYTEERPDSERFLLPASLEVAEQLAQESMVLLKNEGVLPLKDVAKVALVGPFADNQVDLLGNWAARGRAEDVTSIYDALVKELDGKAEVILAAGCVFDGEDVSGFAEAVKAADSADVVIVCLGEKRGWSGENASRSTIALPEIQEQFLETVAATGKPVILVLSSGRPLDVTRMEKHADAMLEIWQPGVCAGPAVAGILSGRYNPSGRLAITFPYTTGQIPIYYDRRNSGRRRGDNREIS